MPNGGDGNGANGGEGPESVVVYLRAMADELGKMAQRHGLDTLVYLFEMARLEAERLSQSDGGGYTSDTLPPP